jgi:hypothetical protein
MKRAEVLFGQSLPSLAVSGRPEIARQAAGQAFAAVINLYQSLLALIAASGAVMVRH